MQENHVRLTGVWLARAGPQGAEGHGNKPGFGGDHRESVPAMPGLGAFENPK